MGNKGEKNLKNMLFRINEQEYDLSLKSKLDESLRATGVMMSAIEKWQSVVSRKPPEGNCPYYEA